MNQGKQEKDKINPNPKDKDKEKEKPKTNGFTLEELAKKFNRKV